MSSRLQSIHNHMVGRTGSVISPFYSLLPGYIPLHNSTHSYINMYSSIYMYCILTLKHSFTRKLRCPRKYKLSQLRILKPSQDNTRGSTEFHNQNLG